MDIGNGLFQALLAMIIIVALVVAFVVSVVWWVITPDSDIKETKEKPAITWRLEAKGQKVDTVWIYKFK